MADMTRNDPFGYLQRGGFMGKGIAKGGDRTPKVKTTTVAVKRPPEFPSRTPSGPREGHPAGRVKSTAKHGSSFVNEANVNGRDGDGWTAKKNTPSRSGPETLGAHAGVKEAPGGTKARAAGKRGVETKSATSDKDTHAAVRKTTKTAPVEHGESAMYEKAEQKTLKGLKGSKKKVLREGHNTVMRTTTPLRSGVTTNLRSGVTGTRR